MNKSIAFFMLFLSSYFYSQNGNPVQYMENLNSDSDRIMQANWDYISAIARSKSDFKIQKQRMELLNLTQSALKKAEAIPPYNGDNDLKNATVNFYRKSIENMQGRVDTLIDLQKISNQSYDFMEAYVLYQQELNRLNQKRVEELNYEVKKFAQKNNIQLTMAQSEIGKKIEQGSKVLSYKQNMFLVFARCFMYEQFMLMSMQDKDPAFNPSHAGITLLDLTDVSKITMDTIKDINNDKSIRQQTESALSFFRLEAETFLPEYNNFTKMQNDFDAYKKEFEALPPNEKNAKGKEFNTKVNDINQASQKFQQLFNTYNQKRQQVFEQWNTTADNFVNKYMPH